MKPKVIYVPQANGRENDHTIILIGCGSPTAKETADSQRKVIARRLFKVLSETVPYPLVKMVLARLHKADPSLFVEIKETGK